MATIRAFVGHSYAPEDAEVFRKFASLFDNLTNVMSEFTWDHAEQARPISISEKVMGLTGDKNVFVAIYTKKERILKPHWPLSLRQKMGLSEKDFEWKTSDWIIQETGLAKGLNMSSIFLVEDGVRRPSGLHSDTECIPFDRAKPEECFGKFMQMVGSLRERPETLRLISAEHSSTVAGPSEAEAIRTDKESKWNEPSDSWTENDFEFAYFHATALKLEETKTKIAESYERSRYLESEEKRAAWLAFREFAHIRLGTNGDMENLRIYVNTNPKNHNVRFRYARALETFDRFNEAAAEFEAAALCAPDDKTRTTYLADAAAALRKANDLPASNIALSKARDLASTNVETERAFLKGQRDIAQSSKEDTVLVGTLERLLELNPTDSDSRFSLAYQYSELGEHELALYHYSLIPAPDRNSMTWNNLGAAQNVLGLPASSVTSFSKAQEMGESLAAGNLAHKYLDAGFVEQALAACLEGQKAPEPHKSIFDALKRVKEIPDEEVKQEEDIRVQARKKRDFYNGFGLATIRSIPSSLPTLWTGPGFVLKVTFDKDEFSASADYEMPVNGFATAFGRQAPKELRVDFRGKCWGCAVVGSVSRTDRRATTILGSLESVYDVLIFLESSNSVMRVIETGKNHSEQYKLSAI